MNTQISHIEYCLPETVVTNEMLAREQPDWDFAKIEPKTGVRARHIVQPNETASDLAYRAAEKLIQTANLDRDTIEALILCTQSPDQALPATACGLQDRLGLKTSTAAFDFNQGCSGFVYGLAIGGSMIESGIVDRVLLLTAETYSRFVADDDRAARTVFGDGAAATLLEKSDRAMGPFLLSTDGSGKEKLKTAAESGTQRLTIDGAGVFMFTMNRVPECVRQLLEKAGRQIDEIDLFVFHQASQIVMENLIRILELDPAKVYMDIENIGNTVSASIPIALKKAEQEKVLQKGQRVMLVGFGVGLSWGACLVEW